MDPLKIATRMIQNHIFSLGILVRLVFFCWMEIQDRFYDSKFSDIDYDIFTQGSLMMLSGFSPYRRGTYRYSPFLAWLMAPNNLFYRNFGKVLFLACDICVGLVLRRILQRVSRLPSDQINLLLAVWLLNPLVMMTSARGSFDSLPCLLILLVIWTLLNKKWVLSGMIFGFLVHFRVYPVIYSLTIFLFLKREENKPFSWVLPSTRSLKFFFSALGVFAFLFYHYFTLYGMEFVQETYLYHLSRKDHRHNFSIHFLNTYINYSSLQGAIPTLLMLPQLLALILTSFRFHKNLVVGLFLQTFFFVVMNKVVTAQYFEWFMVFLPLVLADNQLFLKENQRWLLVAAYALWQVLELLMNVPAGLFENHLWDTFLSIHGVNSLFYFCNLAGIIGLMKNQKLVDIQALVLAQESSKKEKTF